MFVYTTRYHTIQDPDNTELNPSIEDFTCILRGPVAKPRKETKQILIFMNEAAITKNAFIQMIKGMLSQKEEAKKQRQIFEWRNAMHRNHGER